MRRLTCGAVAGLSALIPVILGAPTGSATLSDKAIDQVKSNLLQSASSTWVAGTEMEALLELDYPWMSVFYSARYPPSLSSTPDNMISIVQSWASNISPSSSELAHVQGGAAGDPAALGVGWLVAAAFADNATNATYFQEAQNEVDFLLNVVPRTSDGAISHRPPDEPASLWSDFVSMVPPFLAYWGVATGNRSCLAIAYDQIKLYRENLKTSSGAWKHVVYGNFEDPGLWNTGNGWAAYGIMRVLATLKTSPWRDSFGSEISDLKSWASEIIGAAFQNIRDDGFMPNYYDSAYGSDFSDASGSALLAAAAYRLATTGHDPSHVSSADTVRSAAFGGVNSTTGWLSPVVDPLHFKHPGSESPESEAFVLMLQAAYKVYASSAGAS